VEAVGDFLGIVQEGERLELGLVLAVDEAARLEVVLKVVLLEGASGGVELLDVFACSFVVNEEVLVPLATVVEDLLFSDPSGVRWLSSTVGRGETYGRAE